MPFPSSLDLFVHASKLHARPAQQVPLGYRLNIMVLYRDAAPLHLSFKQTVHNFNVDVWSMSRFVDAVSMFGATNSLTFLPVQCLFCSTGMSQTHDSRV